MNFRQISSLLLNREFSLIYPRYRGKISRGIQIFYQNFCCSSLLVPILLLVFMRKSAKPPCVHANSNYHQCTPVMPEWAEIIDLMVFSPAKKSDSKKKSENRHKIALFSIFRDFWINTTLFSEKFLESVFWLDQTSLNLLFQPILTALACTGGKSGWRVHTEVLHFFA